MNGATQYTNEALAEWRRSDKMTDEGETLEAEQTLNARKLRRFLDTHGFTVANIDDKFDLQAGIDLTADETAAGGRELNSKLVQARNFLGKLGVEDDLKESNEKVFDSKMNKYVDEGKITRNEANISKSAHQTLLTIKSLGKNSLFLTNEFREKRDVNIGQDLKTWLANSAESAKGKWNEWPPEQKLAFVAMSLVGTYMVVDFLKSDPGGGGKMKENLFTMAKYGVTAYLGNELVELATGRSAWSNLSNGVSNTVGNEAFWTKIYGNNKDRGEVVRKSTVYLGDTDFMSLAQKYMDAKVAGKNKVEGVVLPSQMTPEEVYKALESFFGRYPAGDLMKKYRNYKPAPTYREIVATEMMEDASLTYKGDIVDSGKELVRSSFMRSYNWLSSTGPANVIHDKYKSWTGKDATPEEIANFRQKLGYTVDKESELNDFVQKNFVISLAEKDGFESALGGSNTDSVNHLKYAEKSDGYIYIVAEKDVSTMMKDDEMVKKAQDDTRDSIQRFALSKYGFGSAGDVAKDTQLYGSVFVADKSKIQYFVRIKKPGFIAPRIVGG